MTTPQLDGYAAAIAEAKPRSVGAHPGRASRHPDEAAIVDAIGAALDHLGPLAEPFSSTTTTTRTTRRRGPAVRREPR